MPLSIRHTNLLIFLGCVFFILVGVYLEHVMKVAPCPLCITQRALIDAVGLLALIAFIHNPGSTGRRAYALAGVVAALGGAGFALRQLWLQSLPADQVPACGPGLAYMFELFPFMDAFKMLLQGDGTCAQIHKVLGLSIPTWSLMAFIGLAIINIFQALRRKEGAVN